jgi:hypothetical protein
VHIGSVDAGPRVAAIHLVVETCRGQETPVRQYLAEVLPGLADRKAAEMAALTPRAWKLHRQGQPGDLIGARMGIAERLRSFRL